MSDIQNRITLQGNFEEVENYNSSFLRTKMKVFAFGKNNNNSSISEEVFENAKSSIFNIPIVAMFTDGDDAYGLSGDLEGHNTIITKDKDGNWVFRQDTYPIGVISSDTTITYEQVNEGTESSPDYKTYVVVDKVYLWKRYDATQKIQEWIENGVVPKISMEIDIKDGKFNADKVYEIDSFEFLAVAALGSRITPCFPQASIEAYSKQEFQNSFFELLQELKTSIAQFEDESTDEKKKITIDNSKDSSVSGSWGDVDKTAFRNEITEASNASSLVKEAYLIVDDDWDEHPSEALHYPHHVVRDGKMIVHKEGVIAAYQRLMQDDPNNKKALRHIKKHYKELGLDMSNFANFSLSLEALRDELRRLVEQKTTVDYWGWEVPCYWYVDVDFDQSLVIAQTREEGYNVGFPYSVDGDKVSVNMGEEKRVKNQWTTMDITDKDVDTNAVVSNFTSVSMMEYNVKVKEAETKKQFETELNEYKQKASDAEFKAKEANGKVDEAIQNAKQSSEQYEQMKENFYQAEKQLNELKEYQSKKVKEEREFAEKTLFEKYSGKLTDEEMDELKAKAGQFSLDELEKECVFLIGQKALSGSFSLNDKNKPLRMPVFEQDNKRGKRHSVEDLIEQYADKN